MYIHWILSSCTVYIIVYSLDRVLPSWLGNYLRIQEVLLLHGGFTLHKLKNSMQNVELVHPNRDLTNGLCQTTFVR